MCIRDRLQGCFDAGSLCTIGCASKDFHLCIPLASLHAWEGIIIPATEKASTGPLCCHIEKDGSHEEGLAHLMVSSAWTIAQSKQLELLRFCILLNFDGDIGLAKDEQVATLRSCLGCAKQGIMGD